jgi:hypothetical protein
MAEIQPAQGLMLTAAEIQASRWYYEREKLRVFPAFALLGASGLITAAEGAIDTQSGNTYGIRITLDSYPYSLPKVYPKGWTLHPDVPHKYNDGTLCIMRSAQWRSYFTVALVVAKAAIWLGKYEIWKRNGHIWPGLEQKH